MSMEYTAASTPARGKGRHCKTASVQRKDRRGKATAVRMRGTLAAEPPRKVS